MSQYKSNLVKCPFYKDETKNTIRCEGIFSEAIQHNFAEAKTKKAHRNNCCCCDYRRCPIFTIVEEKY